MKKTINVNGLYISFEDMFLSIAPLILFICKIKPVRNQGGSLIYLHSNNLTNIEWILCLRGNLTILFVLHSQSSIVKNELVPMHEADVRRLRE